MDDNWKDKFSNLMMDIETSGYRATGLILVKYNDSIQTLKQETNATNFLEIENVKVALNQNLKSIVGHCRFPTKGDAKFNKNNHPFSYGNTIIVHQGILWNDEQLKKKYEFKPEGETDSWIIVHLIEKYRKEGKTVLEAINELHQELEGNWAVTLVDKLEPEKLYLFCRKKEFKVNYFPDDEIFFFSTEDRKLDKYNVQVYNYFDYFQELKSVKVAELMVKDNQCLILGGEKVVEFYNIAEPIKSNDWFGGKKKKEYGRREDGTWGYLGDQQKVENDNNSLTPIPLKI
ncbi:MAG TPA: class II glutamine amidotransferase [Nitrosopumilaceae archaeon]|nr:class II glutamine amidotransferase [Nitrosopumilaceae archaeon]